MQKADVDIAIVGAGASGLMLASHLRQNSYTLIDHNSKVGAKLLVCGGGRCNITNRQVSSKNYLADQQFVSSVLKTYNQHSLLAWVKECGLNPVLINRRDYFCPDSSKQIVDLFCNKINSTTIDLCTKVEKITKVDDLFTIQTHNKKIKANRVIIATGGLSFERLGASSIGYSIAESFGHTIIKPAPALVGFTLQKDQFFFKMLSGISTDVTMSVADKKYRGSLLFAHKGVSGPVVLNASLHWKKGSINIDFLPDFKIQRLKESNKLLSTILPMPKRLSLALLKQLSLQDKASSRLSKDEIDKLLSLKQYSFAPAGTFGYTKAEATRGGVATDEICAETMMSKKIKNLHFIGEVLDVTGELGGYNLQWAFSSAFVCAQSINQASRDG